jgi:hypothetical protein
MNSTPTNNPQNFDMFQGVSLLLISNIGGWFAFFMSLDGFVCFLPFVIAGLILCNVFAIKWIMRAK